MSKTGTKASSKSDGKANNGRAKPTPEESKAQKKARALIYLAFLGGEVPRAGDLKPKLETRLRLELIEQKMLATGRKTSKGLPLTLLDAGWRWVMDNLASPLPAREDVAMAILSRLDKFLRVKGLTAQDVIQPNQITREPAKAVAQEPAAAESSAEKASVLVDEALLKTALDLASGHIGERVRLRDLRPKMEALGYTSAALDEAIRHLQAEGALSVIPIDLPTDIDDRDRAAIIDIAGVPRHAIILRRRPQ